MTSRNVSRALTAERLRELLYYDRDTGVFTHTDHHSRPLNWRRRWAGKVAGGVDGSGYWHIRVEGERILAHKLAWLYVYGVWPEDMIDHRNRDRLDNRIDNLREADRALNMQNFPMKKTNTSGLIGVHRTEGKYWRSQIHAGGKQHYLGRFETKEEAHAAYVEAKARLHTGV